VRLALQVVKLVTDLQLDPVSIDINGDDMILCNLSGKKIFFSTKKDIRQQEYQLTEIIKQFKIKGKQFKAVDLRFEKPIITNL
jgi:bifunctional N-acetylglucosamine-1-phosphate-uridyltransferase/glucosamine-1-phosphate-acetyltransferase GlmU-like protein